MGQIDTGLIAVRLYNHLKLHRCLDALTVLNIFSDIDPHVYSHYMFKKVKEWYGDITFEVHDMMTSRLKIMETVEIKEYCKKICTVGCKSSGERLGLDPFYGDVSTKYELSRHKLSSKSYCINSRYTKYYQGDRSFNSFAFAVALSAKTPEERIYAEGVLCKYVILDLESKGFRGVKIIKSIFEWESDYDQCDIELPSCVRFSDEFISNLEEAKDRYISLLGDYRS